MTIRISEYWRRFIVDECRTVDQPHKCEFCVGDDSLILDCDKIKTAEKHQEPINDCIALEDDDGLYVGIVEMKGKHPRLNHTLKQLDSGERIAIRIIKDSKIKDYKMCKIIAATSYSPSFSSMLRSMRKHSKSHTPIVATHCSDTFSNARKKCR